MEVARTMPTRGFRGCNKDAHEVEKLRVRLNHRREGGISVKLLEAFVDMCRRAVNRLKLVVKLFRGLVRLLGMVPVWWMWVVDAARWWH